MYYVFPLLFLLQSTTWTIMNAINIHHQKRPQMPNKYSFWIQSQKNTNRILYFFFSYITDDHGYVPSVLVTIPSFCRVSWGLTRVTQRVPLDEFTLVFVGFVLVNLGSVFQLLFVFFFFFSHSSIYGFWFSLWYLSSSFL